MTQALETQVCAWQARYENELCPRVSFYSLVWQKHSGSAMKPTGFALGRVRVAGFVLTDHITNPI